MLKKNVSERKKGPVFLQRRVKEEVIPILRVTGERMEGDLIFRIDEGRSV